MVMADLKDLGRDALDKLRGKDLTDLTQEEVIPSAPAPEPTPEEAEEIALKKKARISQILSRGILNDKLEGIVDKCVPPGWGSKFVREDDQSIIRHKNLEFGFTYTEAASEIADPDGIIRVGDAILMTISPEDREILKAAKADQVQRKLSEGRREYKRRAQEAAAQGRLEGSVIDESQQVIHKA
jgi:hypothetical protein